MSMYGTKSWFYLKIAERKDTNTQREDRKWPIVNKKELENEMYFVYTKVFNILRVFIVIVHYMQINTIAQKISPCFGCSFVFLMMISQTLRSKRQANS